MIEILQIASDGGDKLVRLGCSCGEPELALYPCDDDQIIFCTHCSEITSRSRLINEASLALEPAEVIWLNVANRAECPLVGACIPVEVHFAQASGTAPESLAGVVTKLSTEKCFLRLETSADNTGPKSGRIMLKGSMDPLTGETAGEIEEVFHASGLKNGPAYYKIRLTPGLPERREALERYFHASSGLHCEWRILLCADEGYGARLRQLLRRCLPAADITFVENAAEALRHLAAKPPDLALLPLEALSVAAGQTRGRAAWPGVRLVALIDERTVSNVGQALRMGAIDVLAGGCEIDEVRRILQRCQRRDANAASLIHAPSQTYSGTNTIVRAVKALVGVTEDDIVRVLCMASESHDANSSNHLNRMSAYSAAIASQLDWPSRRVALLATASKLHDVGKLGVPDEILRKPGALTHDERLVMQQHTRFGQHILNASAAELMRLGALIALRHHERFDGAGYPDGLAGAAIPVEAQVVSLSDVYDALTTARAYKPAWTSEQAVAWIQEQAGGMFQPELVEAFLRALPEIERDKLRFLDDFRDIWTERRRHPRHPVAHMPVGLEIAMPEHTFRPLPIQAQIRDVSAGGIKVLLRGVSQDLFGSLISARRYAKLCCAQPEWHTLHQASCSVEWVDYYAVPDPEECLMGLSFQKTTPEWLETVQGIERMAC